MIATVSLHCFVCMATRDVYTVKGESNVSFNLDAYRDMECRHCGNIEWRLDIIIKNGGKESNEPTTK